MNGTIVIVALVAAGVGAAVALAAVLGRRGDASVDDGTAALLQEQAAGIRRVLDAIGRQTVDDQAVRRGLEETRAAVEAMRAQSEARRHTDEQTWEAVRRLETVLAGASTRGRAGENLLEQSLGHLPAGMVVRDFAVNGKRVEFAMILPDGRRMPIDSKWAALREVEELTAEEDPQTRERLGRRLEDEVAKRAREVASYLEPSLTTPFAVACVPDAAFEVCRRAHAEAFRNRVILVGYSSALPVLLSLYVLASRFGRSGDVEDCLTEIDGLLGQMEQTLENKVARATTMLHNAAEDWRGHLGRARGSLARGRGISGPGDEDELGGPALTALP